ncbi:MAG: hypothetical protein KC729_10070 [Candidatus Eisenbacteria bacterium]|uniref:YfhO family protein n=1 Tax=Eiseniibacteriota bacterium TaxID=2212470 RepID=A0A956M0P7_UNCEI|nr:hypothetical protein [Candidatus Eisenbacteria bacterium]
MTRWIARRWARLLIVTLGLILCQFVLYGSALVGRTLLLPLDLLALSNVYLPATAEYASVAPGNPTFSDILFEYEMNRRFAATEFRAGRLPLWNPGAYTGVPFANFAKYSPFLLLYYLFDAPWTLAWIQLLTALVAGLGAYAFFREGPRLSFWPAACVAWCVPLSGFFVLWEGFSLVYAAAWFPWLLYAVERTMRAPRRGGVLLALVTCLLVLSGQIDIGGQALLASGLYALVRLGCLHAIPSDRSRRWRRSFERGSALLAGWGLGLCLAAPHLLPLASYARTGARVASRLAGSEERPPVGLSAVFQFFDPNFLGNARSGSIYFGDGNHLESPAAAYVGALSLFVLVPLAWRDRSRRGWCALFTVLTLVALSWDLAIPGLLSLWRAPILSYFSYNRFVFVSGLLLLGLAGIGLESLRRAPGRLLTIGASVAPAVLGVLAIHRLNHWPDPFRALLDGVKQNTVRHHLMGTPEEVDRITRTFQHDTILFVVICAVAILLLVALRLRCQEARVAVGGAIVLELVIFGCGFAPQGRPALYLPPIGPLDSLETADRVLCANCLPPNLNQRFGFRDVRGYDGVDPARLMDLLDLCRDPKIPVPPYGRAQYFVPVVRLTASHEAAVSPILSLANVQVLVFRGTPPASAVTLFHRDDYWAMANPRACPRAFVPARVETVVDAGSRLAKMGNPDFDPRAVAYVETNLDLPGPCSGQATIVDATRPSRLDIHAEMATPGLLVVSDLWDDGWSAEVNGRPAPILRTDHAFRGVILPPGHSDIQMSYRPRSFRDGLFAMIGAVAVTLVWSASALTSKR